MKKYLFILAGLLCLIGQGKAEARAVKLGRIVTNNNKGPQPPCTGRDCDICSRNKDNKRMRECYCLYHPADSLCKKIQNCGTFCLADQCVLKRNEPFCNRCKDGYFPNAKGECINKCSEIQITDAITGAVTGTTVECDSKDGKVTRAVCNSLHYANYSLAEARSLSQHVCPQVEISGLSCANGYRREPQNDGSYCCVPMCQGVSCVTGFTPTAEEGLCNCKPTNAGNCKTFDNGTCTECQSRYYLDNGTCRSCPLGASCNGTANWSCSSGRYRRYFPCNGWGFYACLECPAHSTCPTGTGQNQEFTCDAGYYEDLYEPDVGGAYYTCMQCPTGCSSCSVTDSGVVCNSCASGYYNSTGLGVCVMQYYCTEKKCIQKQVCPKNPVVTCEACSSGCAVCSDANTCTICESGKYLAQDGTCKACPENGVCNGTATVTCQSGYYPMSYSLSSTKGCVACPTHGSCNGTGTPTCGCSGGQHYTLHHYAANGWGFYTCEPDGNNMTCAAIDHNAAQQAAQHAATNAAAY